jgi:hypothetical protein
MGSRASPTGGVAGSSTSMRPRWITTLVTAAVRKARNEMARTMSKPPTICPTTVVGTMSPYPTVVTVWSAHQNADPKEWKSW